MLSSNNDVSSSVTKDLTLMLLSAPPLSLTVGVEQSTSLSLIEYMQSLDNWKIILFTPQTKIKIYIPHQMANKNSHGFFCHWQNETVLGTHFFYT